MGKLKIPKEIIIEQFNSKYDNWELVSYNGTGKKCIVRHICGREKTYQNYQTVYLHGPLCDICDKNLDFEYNIGDIIDHIEIIDRKLVVSDGKRSNKNTKLYQYKCRKCGFDGSGIYYKDGEEFSGYWVNETSIKNGSRCACCKSRIVQTGVNDITTTHPHLVKYFVDSDVPYKYSYGSSKKEQFMCPICKYVYPNKIAITSFIHEGKMCDNCGKHVSYPERLMYFLLMHIGVQFERNKIFDWSKKVKNSDGSVGYKEYDFYLPQYNTIIETHGKQHYDDNSSFSKYGDKGRTLEEERENDLIKMNLAKINGFNYIVIDCSRSSLSFIRNNMLSSNLANILCFDNIDWDFCHEKSLIGIKALVIQDKRENPNINGVELSKKYNIPHTTIYTWLNDAMEDYKSKVFFAVYSPELNQIFTDFNEASIIAGVSAGMIRRCAHHPEVHKHAGKHPKTGERLTWFGFTKKEYEQNYDNLTNLIHNIC
jgi:predicted Zn-ribbon and HTH transcriptional regulator